MYLVSNMGEEGEDHHDLNADGGEGGHEQLVHVVEAGITLGRPCRDGREIDETKRTKDLGRRPRKLELQGVWQLTVDLERRHEDLDFGTDVTHPKLREAEAEPYRFHPMHRPLREDFFADTGGEAGVTGLTPLLTVPCLGVRE